MTPASRPSPHSAWAPATGPAPSRQHDIGGLVLNAPPELAGRKIQISRPESGGVVRRSHSMVRERITAGGIRYAALYLDVPAGTYTIWRDECNPAGTVTIHSGEVTHYEWTAAHRRAA